MIEKKITRRPITPWEIFKKEFLVPLNLTQKQLANHIDMNIKVINRLVEL